MTNDKLKLIFLLIICATLGQIFCEAYIPALPIMQDYFHITDAKAEISLSIFLLCSALSCIFIGYISDAVGRKNILLYSLIICSIGSLICSLSSNFDIFLFGRTIQGLGCSGIASTGRAILRDKYDGIKLAKASSYMSICITLAIDFSPFIGSLLLTSLGWQFIFFFFLIYSLSGFFICKNLSDLDDYSKTKLNIRELPQNFFAILITNHFTKLAIL